ncbi:LCP family protein [Clostridium cadaveris]|uniref:Transcriptional attenuator, LytR family n=1 Tax=Clostridium cadaveris TaxID=1529 RepID=A0A1I2N8T2_9CLOT|nr:LCP family protein [Clostridium cadaveris]MDM8312079.1 LCP family protein [Clostridium cadaveris]SFF99530.1 transcriptional attenuator, LytR family [Clostridium cadaveris]
MSRKKSKIIIISIVAILALIFLAGGYAVYSKLSKIKTTKIELPDEEIGIQKHENEEVKNKKDVTSILLLGLDREEHATDVNMVLTLDDDNKEIRLLSILRDSYIYYGEDKTNKLNYAINYGGVTNSIKTVNENYGTEIRDYILIDFDGVMNLVDAMGGVNVNLTSEEIPYISPNKNLKSGNNVLSGKQALSYSRIRRIGTDFQRTQRQRNVINAMYSKVKSLSLGEMNKLLDVALNNVETSLSYGEILSLGQKIISYGGKEIKQGRVPIDGTWHDDYKELYYLMWDKEPNLKYIRDFIYGE